MQLIPQSLLSGLKNFSTPLAGCPTGEKKFIRAGRKEYLEGVSCLSKTHIKKRRIVFISTHHRRRMISVIIRIKNYIQVNYLICKHRVDL